ncbi:MAG: triose-phosphate isomerase [Patescibacteria group bacterium]
MKKNKRPLIIGNWKTNPASFDRAKERFRAIKQSAAEHSSIDVVICPPFPYISALSGLINTKNILVGAQDLSVYSEGSKTGEVSAHMIESSGASAVIIGHSERRAMGETDTVVAAKMGQALKTGMQVILCVGETDRDNDGKYLGVIKNQLKEALTTIERPQFKQIIVAYEPVWAIGRKDNVAITSHDLHQMVIYIKKLFTEWWSDTIASIVPILYGGSVTAENAQDIMWNGMVDGLLVGRASWEVETFGPLLGAVDSRQKSTIKLTTKKPREDARKEAQLKAKKILKKTVVKKVIKKKTKRASKKGKR